MNSIIQTLSNSYLILYFEDLYALRHINRNDSCFSLFYLRFNGQSTKLFPNNIFTYNIISIGHLQAILQISLCVWTWIHSFHILNRSPFSVTTFKYLLHENWLQANIKENQFVSFKRNSSCFRKRILLFSIGPFLIWA